MDSRMPHAGNDGYGNANNGLFADNQQFSQYDNLFSNGNNFSTSNDASWGLNASGFDQDQSRVPNSATPSWQQNVNHLSAPPTQHGFDGTSSPFGRALNHSPAPYAQPNFGSATGQQTYPYRQQQFDPSLINQGNNGHGYNLPFTSAGQGAGTIAPQALNQTPYMPQNAQAIYQNRPTATQQQQPQQQQQPARRITHASFANAVPKGADANMFSIINFDGLSRTTNSERMGNYVNVGKEPVEWDITRSAVPPYIPRRSRSELRKLAGTNQSALAKIGRKSKTLSSVNTKLSGEQIKYEQSSSDDSSSSDDESDYSDDADDSDSPLPATRPESPKAGVEYDVIKALWRSKRKVIDGPTIRQTMADFWDIIKTIRDRWKADTAALTDAENKKKTGELPLLRSRVKDQREMAEAAFRAAFKHGHRAIVELLSENIPLVFVLYQFLVDRIKADDLNGSLSRAILELMAAFTTLTQDKAEKVHLQKILPRFEKNGDAKTKFWAKKILSNTDIATKDAAAKEPKKTDKPTDGAASTAKTDTVKKAGPEPIAGVKRAASSSADGGASKKVATVTAKANGTTTAARLTGNAATKNLNETGKSATVGAVPIKKTVVAKPSNFFSSLQSASKKPGTSNAERTAKPVAAKTNGAAVTATAAKPAFSFAETMANLAKPKKEEVKPVKQEAPARPEETLEERTKRLRKEQRRKLHVSFKTGEDLEEIRYFTHDPDEEIDHDSSQMRDMTDVGGEGRMLKQKHQMMDLDDDDDDTTDEEVKLVEFRAPSQIDFSVMPREEIERNYAPYGGGNMQPISPERAKREQYENNTLMVFYTNPNEIPPNPKEPENPYNSDQEGLFKPFGPPEENTLWAIRAREVAARRNHMQYQPHPVAPQPPPGFGFSQPQAQQPDIGAILASLQAVNQHVPQQQAGPVAYAPPHMGANNFHTPPPPPPQPPAALPANFDIAAILAQIQQPQQQVQGHQGQAAQAPNYRTKVCKFYQSGKCDKGDACNYLHQ